MPASATVRVMSAEEIAARAGGETPPFHWPERATVFAERAMRLRQLANGHAMGDFLAFMAELALAQQSALEAFPSVPIPDLAALDRAARAGVPPLDSADWPRDISWQGVVDALVAHLRPRSPTGPAAEMLQRLAAADGDFLERQADALLGGGMTGLDLAAAPVVAAALQVCWTHMVIELQAAHAARGRRNEQPVGRLDDPGRCPCCGGSPVASITRSGGESTGQRYLHCSLCNTQWHLPRGRCARCGATQGLTYHSLDRADSGGEDDRDQQDSAARAAKASIQAETCNDCGHYLKIVHSDRDPFVDPVADDLGSITLDLLMAEAGRLRHGVNLMLLFGEPEPDVPPPRGAP